MANGKGVRIYTAYDPPPVDASNTVSCTLDEGKTVQSALQETDLNFLLRDLRGVDGVPVIGSSEGAVYADVSEIGDYQSSLDVIMRASDAFLAQSAEIRDRFKNDAGKFVDFVADPANKDEAIKLGLIEAPKVDPSPLVAPAGA